jgi:protein-disulfide isomerase
MPPQRYLDTVFTAVMAASCVVATIAIVRKPKPPPPPSSEPVAVADWKSYTTRGERTGAPAAKVIITEFSDFQCPYCRRLKATLDTVLARHPTDVTVLYRHFPLPQLHQHATAAAYAAVCAGQQDRFKEYHDLLYQRQDSIGKLRWTVLAKRAGIPDTTAFARCLADPITIAAVDSDIEAAKRLKAKGTPTVLVNGWRLQSALTVKAIEDLIEAELKK